MTMIDLARPGDYLEMLGARVQDAITFVAYDEDGIWALQGLTLTILARPIADIDEVYAELNRFDRTIHRYIEIGKAAGEKWADSVSRTLSFAFPSEYDRPPSLSASTTLALSLVTGVELWRQEAKRGRGGLETTRIPASAPTDDLGQKTERGAPPLLAFTVATPGIADSEKARLVFAEPRSVLTLCPGSLTALWSGATTVIKAIGWAVSFLRGTAGRVRSAEAAAHAFVENFRNERETSNPVPLIRLDQTTAPLPPDLKGAMIFVHGLMSTDLGTFDGFLKKWLKPAPTMCPPELFAQGRELILSDQLPQPAIQAIKDAVSFLGWPHDTLTSIDQNAHSLAQLIDMHLGNLSYPIAFVCHSRGGLVARAAFEKLCAKDKIWENRVCLCVTFGTPHAGIALAEHPDRQLGAYVLAGLTRKHLATFVDMAAYLEQRGKVDGIDDLRPASAPNKPFLRELEALEWKSAPRGHKRRLPIYAVGGVVRLGNAPGPLLERLGRLYDAYHAFYTGQTEHDLVVPFSSATAADDGHSEIKTTCDHFSYFSDDFCGRQATEAIILELWKRFGLANHIAPFCRSTRPETDERSIGLIDSLGRALHES
jgi:Putative serine esterase (DUF676)